MQGRILVNLEDQLLKLGGSVLLAMKGGWLVYITFFRNWTFLWRSWVALSYALRIVAKGRFTWGPKVPGPTSVNMSSDVEAKSQISSLMLAFECIFIEVVSSLFHATKIAGRLLRVGSRFLFNPTLNTSPEPSLQKVLLCGLLCHAWDLGLGIMCEVVSPNFHAINGWDCMMQPRVNWDHTWMNPELLCCCLCLFDAIIESHAMDEKCSMTFSLESESRFYMWQRPISFMLYVLHMMWQGYLSHQIESSV